MQKACFVLKKFFFFNGLVHPKIYNLLSLGDVDEIFDEMYFFIETDLETNVSHYIICSPMDPLR